MSVKKRISSKLYQLSYRLNRPRCSDDHPRSGKSSWYLPGYRCESLRCWFPVVPIGDTWFIAKFMSLDESTILHAKSTAEHYESPHTGKSYQYLPWWSCQSSWPLNRDGSCRWHLIHCKNHEFNESTILSASQIDRTTTHTTGTAAKAINTCLDIAAKILDADSQWLLSPPPVSSDKFC